MQFDQQCENIIAEHRGQGAVTPALALISTAAVIAMHLGLEQRLAIADAMRAEAARLDRREPLAVQ
jgi:hypothetical protein